MPKQSIIDKEFGTITVSRTARSRHIRIRIAPDGSIRVSAPSLTPLFVIKRTVASSHRELREMIQKQRPALSYQNGSEIGKSHSLVVRQSSTLRVQRHGLKIILSLPAHKSLQDEDVQELLRKQAVAALRREAKGYLTKRLKFLADKNNFTYDRVRFSHASSRWGSCSSRGTISLNIALMKLPFELIDYVLIHELAHTKHMNHSVNFWELVAQHDPNYKTHRARLKRESPLI